jgi:hypothetical protein
LVLTRGKDEEWIWGGVDSPDGTDYQQLPDDIQGDANFLRMVRKGLLKIVPMEDAIGALDQQAQSWHDEQQAQIEGAMSTLDHVADRDMVATVDQATGLPVFTSLSEPVEASPNDLVFSAPGADGVQYVDAELVPEPGDIHSAAAPGAPADFATLVQRAAQEKT